MNECDNIANAMNAAAVMNVGRRNIPGVDAWDSVVTVELMH